MEDDDGLVNTNAATASATERPTRRQAPHPATTSGTSRIAPGYFAEAASPAATPAHSSRPERSEREAQGDAERQQHIGDGHARVRDVGGRDGDDDGRGDAGERPDRDPPEPPGRGDAEHPQANGDDTRRPVRRLVEPQLRRREEQEEEARVVVPAGVDRHRQRSPTTEGRCSSRRVEQRERQPRPGADRAEERREAEDRSEEQDGAGSGALARAAPS